MFLPTLLLALAPEPSIGLQSAPDWPQWRGPARDGSCAGAPWPDGLGEEHLRLRWRVPLGKGYSSPIVAGDRVFTFETAGEREEVVRALSLATGEELWSTRWDGAMTVPFFAARNGSWARATPAFDGETLYVAGMLDVLVALDARDGAVRWKVDFAQRSGNDRPSFGGVSSPLVVGDHVAHQAGDALYWLDKRTGETVWRALDGERTDGSFSSPVLAEVAGVPQLLVQTRRELCGVAPADGAVLWRVEVPAFRGMNILTPTPCADGVFTSAYNGRSQLLVPERAEKGQDGAAEWSVRLAWEASPRGYMTTPVVAHGHAYLYLQSHRMTCVRLADGAVAWTSEPLMDDYWSLLVQGERILALTCEGELVLLDATPEGYRERERARVSEAETWAHLAWTPGALYVRELEALAVYDWR